MLFFILSSLLILQSCSVSKQIGKHADKILFQDSVISTGHIGISIYEPATNTWLYNYNADKYFVPASNTKLFTLYAAMKYLGDSLVGIYYQNFNDSSLNIFPTGDPTFLHPDFPDQPALGFLQKENKNIYIANSFRDSVLGKGWAWDDYNDRYMVERSAMPIYGNTVRFKLNNITGFYPGYLKWESKPQLFKDSIVTQYVLPWKIRAMRQMQDSALSKLALFNFFIIRNRTSNNYLLDNLTTNNFTLKDSNSKFTSQEIPFSVNGINTAKQILRNEFNLKIKEGWQSDNSLYPGIPPHLQLHRLNSQPTDSVLIPMMHRSDNFFAEQTLLMASNEHLGFMNDEAIIDTLLNKDLKDIPQRPTWVDGSGLSRYNLFTPQSFIYILTKMKNEFGLERLKKILPTGGQGTLKEYYTNDSTFIYAKTGTLGGTIALSGFLITKKNKLLAFSVLTNNFKGKASIVRRAVEQFIIGIREKY